MAYDDFTRYSSTADLAANISVNVGGTGNWRTAFYGDGYHAQLAELDRGTLYNGHPTLKYNQLGGFDNGPALWSSFPNGKTLSTMWFRAKIRFSPGYTTTGTLTNFSNAYKLLGWGFAGTDGSGRLEITNTTEYEIYFGGGKPGSTIQVHTDHYGAGTHVDQEWTDGGWYDYIIEYMITSPTTAKARVWMAKDGQTPVLRETALGSADAGYTVPRVYSAELGLNFNQVRAANQNQAVWWGQWEVVDGDQYPDPFHVSGGSN